MFNLEVCPTSKRLRILSKYNFILAQGEMLIFSVLCEPRTVRCGGTGVVEGGKGLEVGQLKPRWGCEGVKGRGSVRTKSV